jgi:Na+-transporting NADH:ubiquinone oxidoreductase subunit C
MIRERRWFAVVYMFVVTAFFSSIVIGFAQFTKADVEANRRLAFESAVLMVLPGLFDAQVGRLELHRRFVEEVAEPDESSAGAYMLASDGGLVAYALPFSGQGFWAPIKGVIGVRADRTTITAFAIYEQNETPGLGAEIASVAFTDQFKGKTLASGPQPLDFRRSGDALGPSNVHAVTGATQTSNRLESMINAAVTDWRAKLAERSEPR